MPVSCPSRSGRRRLAFRQLLEHVSVWSILAFFALGLAVTWPLVPIIIRRSQAAAVARGNSFHQTHTVPVPRFGGLALAIAFALVVLAAHLVLDIPGDRLNANLGLVLTALAMFALGFADDIRPLGARKKLLGQILIAIVAALWVSRIQVFMHPLTGQTLELGAWGLVITVFWLVAFTNLINLIDGIDGLAVGISLMLMALLAYVGSGLGPNLPVCCAAGMVGALLALLRFNFPPAKIYLGDGGAYFLGFLIGILSMRQSQKGTVVAALVAPLFALALPILDVTLAILRRGFKGVPIFRADRKHLHHRLMDEGFSRRGTVLILYGFSVICLLMAFGVFWSKGRWVPIAFGFLCLLLLLAASRLNFARQWFAVWRVVGDSIEVRKEAQYALALGQWFELEAERSATAEALWLEYEFLVRKVGFAAVHLETDGWRQTWASGAAGPPPEVVKRRVALHHNTQQALEFAVDPARMSVRMFDQLTDLAAEAWMRGVNRWESVHARALEFQPAPAADNAETGALAAPAK